MKAKRKYKFNPELRKQIADSDKRTPFEKWFDNETTETKYRTHDGILILQRYKSMFKKAFEDGYMKARGLFR